MESLSTYTTWVPGQTCWPVSRTSPRFGYVSREPQTRSSASALPRRCRSAVLSRSPGTTSAMAPPTWPLAPNSPFAATLASAAWRPWRMFRWSAEYPFLDCYQKLQVLHTMMVAVTHSDEGVAFLSPYRRLWAPGLCSHWAGRSRADGPVLRRALQRPCQDHDW